MSGMLEKMQKEQTTGKFLGTKPYPYNETLSNKRDCRIREDIIKVYKILQGRNCGFYQRREEEMGMNSASRREEEEDLNGREEKDYVTGLIRI